MMDLRPAFIAKANWCVPNRPLLPYLKHRPFDLYEPTPEHLLECDCSETTIFCMWAVGLPEPFPGAYGVKGIGCDGNTESFLGLKHVPAPIAGDAVVYGEGLPLSVQHMAIVVEAGPDPLTMSHGWSGEPAFVRVSQGCPAAAQGRVTFVRLNTIVPDPTEEAVNPVLTTNPNNGGTIVLDTALGTYKGLSNPGVEAYLMNVCKIPKVAAPSPAVFAKFVQIGTI